MPIKAIVNGTEKEIARIPVLGHDIETATGTNSVTFNTSSDRVIECDILGNSQQTGTPAPDNPIMPEFVGEQTGNLVDATSPSECVRTTATPLANGGVELSITNVTWTAAKYANIPVTANSTYTITVYIDEYSGTGTFMMPCRQIDSYGTAIFTDTITSTGKKTHTFTADGSTVWLGVYLNNSNTAATATAKIRIMLSEGALGQDYESYGYKLPIANAGQTQNVYLGQTQTTRKIKKIVLTGQETWYKQNTEIANRAYFEVVLISDSVIEGEGLCTHFVRANVVKATTDSGFRLISTGQLRIRTSDVATLSRDAFKQWLATQYAAGTPVVIWYVLAEPETSIVNEPLCKINTYADELHITDEVTIPAIKGTNTLTVDTTLSPSSTTVTYRGTTAVYKDAWEVRDNQDRLLWYREDTLTGTSSISYKGYGIPLKSMSVLGNSVQNGTPAPDAPIMPEFVGEKTGNLFDGNLTVGYFSGVNFEVSAVERFRSIRLHLKSGKYTFSFEHPIRLVRVIVDNTYFIDVATNITEYTITITDDNYDIGISFRDEREQTSWDNSPIMLNAGSTPLPYEPYGHKLPITNTGQTQAIYLGQVQTVRRIKKMVLTGQETGWQNNFGQSLFGISFPTMAKIGGISTQFLLNPIQSGLDAGLRNGEFTTQVLRTGSALYCKNTAFTTVDTWKQWLAQQYSAGTPVIIWYVLAEPETGIVNEPLCKIGDYADTLDSADAGITIPTAKGANTLTVDTTLSPSSVSITGHIKETV